MSEISGKALSEIVMTAELAVTGSEAGRSTLARLLEGIDLAGAGAPQDSAYLAVLLDWLGMREQAMLILRPADGEHGDRGAAKRNLAGILASGHGDYERARVLFGRALEAAGDGTSLRAKILANLAALSLLTGEAESASAWLARGGDAGRELSDPATRVLVASTEFAIARVRNDLPRLREAVSQLNQATRARIAELGSDHPLSLTAVASLAAAEFELAAIEESVENQERAIAVLEIAAHRLAADLGADHPQALACLENLCVGDLRLALASGRTDRARRAASALKSVSRRTAAALGEDHPQARAAAANAVLVRLERQMTSRGGRIVTFYSFKGGTGRTMALANVAWILAANGKRVLIADWDLESPGLHRFFEPFIDARAAGRPGIVDLVRGYAWAMAYAGIDSEALHSAGLSRKGVLSAINAIIDEHIGRLEGYVIPLNWQFPDDGSLHFLSPGKQNNGDYQAALSSLNWDNFYENLCGDLFMTALREYLKSQYDYVLIDSRTGHGDVADICTVHLPDMVVDCFTLTSQGMDGAAMMAREIREHSDRDITILPVPMRIDHAQEEKVGAGLRFAASLFAGLPAGMPEEERRDYWDTVEVPYRPSYAYEDTLAAFHDRPGSQSGLLPYYERIAALITGGEITTLPPREEWLRLRTRLLFSRTQSSNLLEVVLDFSPEDQLWAEWITGVLADAEIIVRWVDEMSASPDDNEDPEESEVAAQTVAIVSESYAARMRESPPTRLPDLLISVTEARVPAALTDVPVVFLAGLPEQRAADALIERLNGRRPAGFESATSTLSYPGGSRT